MLFKFYINISGINKKIFLKLIAVIEGENGAEYIAI